MKKIKLLVILASLICAITAMCVCANAATYSGYCGGEGDGTNLSWKLDTSTGVLEITGTGAMENWSDDTSAPWLPYHSSIKTVTLGESVTSIGNYAFYDCYSLASVDMPSVTSIGKCAFEYCASLASVSMPSVTSIGAYAFYFCNALESVNTPSVTSIGSRAFEYCTSLESVSMPSVTSIGDHAFSNCSSLASLSMSSVTSIGSDAFYCCNSLENVEIPSSVTSIGFLAFSWCSNLKKVTIYSKTAAFNTTVFKNTHADFAIHGYSGSTAQTYANANGHTFVAIREVLDEGYCGGEGDGTNLSWILYADGELVISGEGSMADLSFGSAPWYSCRSSIKNVILGDGVTSIGYWAFEDCDSLISVDMPSVTSIYDRAFEGCDSLVSVDMPNVTSIDEYAFYNCTSLASVEIPASVTNIAGNAFYNCYSIESITVDEANIVYSSDEYGVLFDKNKTTLIQYPIGNSRTAYIVPVSVINIDNCAFRDCSFIKSVEMSNVTSVGDWAFAFCDSLESVEMPSVTIIGYCAFRYCSNLKKAVIYSTTATFGSYVFGSTHADFAIHAYIGSTAHTYANNNGHTFVPLKCVGEHDYEVDTDLSTNPTCVAGGTTVEVCSACSDVKETHILELGHEWFKAGRANGAWLYECEVCHDTEPRPFEFVPGDADGNGYVTIRDAALILQQIASWNVELNIDAADADGNCAITIRDAALILQYIAGWNVTLG